MLAKGAIYCCNKLLIKNKNVNSRFLQLLQSTNNLPSNSKPPQIKMQSTKKAPQRREEGATVAGDDGVTIAQPAGLNMTQLVSCPNKNT